MKFASQHIAKLSLAWITIEKMVLCILCTHARNDAGATFCTEPFTSDSLTWTSSHWVVFNWHLRRTPVDPGKRQLFKGPYHYSGESIPTFCACSNLSNSWCTSVIISTGKTSSIGDSLIPVIGKQDDASNAWWLTLPPVEKMDIKIWYL